MKKDIDLLKKRNRKRRDLMERAGSTGLALSGFIGLMFLSVLVWQIAVPTFIEGETGQIEPASEFIPVSEYVLKWDHPTVDDDGALIGDPVVLELTWDDGGTERTHSIAVTVTSERNLREDIVINASGVSTEAVEVGKKTKFYIQSSLEVPVDIHQTSGPVPAADETGSPTVSSFVISADVSVVVDDGRFVSHPLTMVAWLMLVFVVALLSFPMPAVLSAMEALLNRQAAVRYALYGLAAGTLALAGFTLEAWLGAGCWTMSAVGINRTLQGMERLKSQGRDVTQFDRLKHSITNREGVLMWSRMLLVFSTLFIPLLIDVPFLTERYQDIFQPYASGIRSAFFGTIWVMGIAMVVSMPVSIGAAIYLEEYAAPTKTTKLIQAS